MSVQDDNQNPLATSDPDVDWGDEAFALADALGLDLQTFFEDGNDPPELWGALFVTVSHLVGQ